MDENLEAQEPDTNLMATLWQPYGNLMATLWQPYDLAWKNLAMRRYEIDFEYSDIRLAETKNNTYLCSGLSLTVLKVVPLVCEYKRVVARHQTKQCLPLHFFPKDWIVGTDLVLDVHFHKKPPACEGRRFLYV